MGRNPSDYESEAEEYKATADAIEQLADSLAGADSIAEDCPVLSELFHAVRTSSRKSRSGRYVALLDLDLEAGEWSCRSVAFLESGSHYRDTGADLSIGFKPYPFISVDEFAEHVSESIRRDARAERQTAGDLERSAKEARQIEEHYQ